MSKQLSYYRTRASRAARWRTSTTTMGTLHDRTNSVRCKASNIAHAHSHTPLAVLFNAIHIALQSIEQHHHHHRRTFEAADQRTEQSSKQRQCDRNTGGVVDAATITLRIHPTARSRVGVCVRMCMCRMHGSSDARSHQDQVTIKIRFPLRVRSHS